MNNRGIVLREAGIDLNRKGRFLKKGGEILAVGSMIGVLLAGCGGGGSGGAAASSPAPLSITPALGQVHSGQITVSGSNGTSRSYAIASGVPSVTADISGMTAPLLVALTGNPANGNQLAFFDEGQNGIATSVVSTSATAVRAIVPSVTSLPATGVAVTPLTEVAAALVANASGVVNISTLSVAAASGANAQALALAQNLSGSSTITDVLTPPTSVTVRTQTLGTTASDQYAKVLYTLANLPSATYGANAYAMARKLGDVIINTGKLPGTFDTDVALANAAVTSAGYTGTVPVATTVMAPVGTVATPITTTYTDFNYLQNVNGAASAVSASILDNGSGTQTGNLTFGPAPTTTSFNSVNLGASYSWGLPISYANGFNSSMTDGNVPAVAMICQPGVGNSFGLGKSTDVLVTSASTAITSAAALAGQSFTSYYEDCGTSTTTNGQSASVDANGNATFHVINNGVATTLSLTASQFTAMLTGTPNTQTGGFVTLNAYSYKTAFGMTKYVLVEHGGNAATGPTSGYVGIWKQ